MPINSIEDLLNALEVCAGLTGASENLVHSAKGCLDYMHAIGLELAEPECILGEFFVGATEQTSN